MTTVIKTKNSTTTTSAPSSLAQGELAVNITDKKLWVGNAATTPIQLLGAGADLSLSTATLSGNLTLSGGTANGVLYLNGSKVATSGSALVFDGTNLGLGQAASAWGSNFKATQIGNYGAFLAGQTGQSQVFVGANAYNDGTNWKYINSAQATRYYQNAGIHVWDAVGSGTAGSTLTWNTQMYLDSSGNLGLGVTPSAWRSNYKAIQAGNGAVFSGANTSSTAWMGSNWYTNSGNTDTYIANGYASTYAQFSGTHVWYTAPSGTAGNAISFTQAMTLGASGSLGVGDGATNPDSTVSSATGGKGLVIGGTAGGYLPTLILTKTGSSGGARTWAQYVTNDANGSYVFYDATASAERMRIDSSGNTSFATTTTNPVGVRTNGLVIAGAGNAGFLGSRHSVGWDIGLSTSSGTQIYWYTDNGSSYVTAGSITSSGSVTAYNVTSDERLKNDLGISTDTSVIDNTIIHDFDWKLDGSRSKGVFAQEAILVKPEAVTKGENDNLNEQGFPIRPWGVDYSKYVPDLIVYCQQLKAEINALKAQLGAK